MYNMQQIKKMLQRVQIVRSPRHRLATFGNSRIEYQLITDVPGFSDRARLREGVVTAEKPAIITPQSLAEQFQGFGDGVKEFMDTLVSQYGKGLRGLEYQFKNEVLSSRVELSPPDALTESLSKEFDGSGEFHHALIRGTDKVWELSVMRFIIEETMASFNSNVQELNERGFFEGEGRFRKKKKAEIEQLFRMAKADRSVIPRLGAKLKEYGLFERYQDSFFQLIGKP